MKRLLSYIILTVLVCSSLSSCIYEHFDSVNTGTTTPILQLYLNMPATSDRPGTKGLIGDEQLSEEIGTVYECMISSYHYVDIFLFDKNDKFLYKPTDLSLTTKDETTYSLTAKLPVELLGQKVRVVVMANFNAQNFNSAPSNPTAGQDFKKWASQQKLRYEGVNTNEPDENMYIPMTGVLNMVINPDITKVSTREISLTRAIAKVRIRPKTDNLEIENVLLFQSRNLSYSFPLSNFGISQQSLNPNGFQSAQRSFGQTYTATFGKPLEFYVSEQDAFNTSGPVTGISFNFKDEPEKTHRFYFQYKNGSDILNHKIERNTIYDFVISRKEANLKVDVQASIMDWIPHNIDINIR